MNSFGWDNAESPPRHTLPRPPGLDVVSASLPSKVVAEDTDTSRLDDIGEGDDADQGGLIRHAGRKGSVLNFQQAEPGSGADVADLNGLPPINLPASRSGGAEMRKLLSPSSGRAAEPPSSKSPLVVRKRKKKSKIARDRSPTQVKPLTFVRCSQR